MVISKTMLDVLGFSEDLKMIKKNKETIVQNTIILINKTNTIKLLVKKKK